MRHQRLPILAVLVAASCALPAHAWSEGRVYMGPMIWRHDTNLQVEHATDFDGSDITFDEGLKEWDVVGSGVGVRLSYEFPRLLMLYGEAGTSQATVRDKNVIAPSQSVGSLGMNGGAYYLFGLQAGDYFSRTSAMFWRLGVSAGATSTGLDQNVNTSWDYDETRIALEGKLGGWVRQIGLYGGVRLVHASADLRESDRTNPPGFQVRTTELRRDSPVDLLVGAQTRGSEISGFTELGLMGTFSATAGLALR